jgi:large subunit ribosomal protein L22
MKARAQAKYVRQSPYKVRLVLDLVRGMPVDDARATLDFTNRRAAPTIKKVLESAVANAEHNFALDADELFISEAFADEGPTLKRWRPRARGRATRIRKRTSHITIVVADEDDFEGEDA